MHPIVTIVTPTTGDPCVLRALESVSRQTYRNIQHLVVLDGPDCAAETKQAIRTFPVDVIELPYATGKDRFNGHRIYGASVFLGKGEYFCFLDEDNWYDPEHVESLLDVVRRGGSWAFSLRKIVDRDGNFVCNDDCESLGKWPSVLGDRHYLVDVGCLFLSRAVALLTCPLWYRKTREPGVPDPDRALTAVLRAKTTDYDTTGRYTLNYRAGNTAISVRPDFFLRGNARMLQKFHGQLPWKRKYAPNVPQSGRRPLAL